MRSLLPASLLFAFALTGCPSKEENKSSPPPPPPPSATAAAGACGEHGERGGQVDDPVSAPFFPRAAGGYCVDPQGGEAKTFGDKAKHPLDDVCTDMLDGECEVYKGYKMTRAVAVRYVDGAGKGGSVEVHLTTFADPPHAYGMFTKRVIAGADPADESSPKPIAGPPPGTAEMGTGIAYLWKGQYLAELAYNNEQESPEQLAKSSAAILPAIATDMAAKLPGSAEKPAAARALPEAGLVSPAAIEFLTSDAYGVPHLSPVALGYYKDGGKRWRVLAFAPTEPEQAKDEMKALRATPGALPVAGVGDEGAHAMLKSGEKKLEIVAARKGGLLLGVVDEDLAPDAARLTKDEKTAKLKASLAGASAPASSAAPPASAVPGERPAPSASAPKK